MHYKKLVTHVESHASAVSLLESGEQHCIKAIIITFTSSLTGGSFLQRIVGDKSKWQSALVEKERKKPSSADDLTSAVD